MINVEPVRRNFLLKINALAVCVMLICIPVETILAQSTVTAEKIGSKIDVYIDGRFFTSYTFSQDEKYPFFYPVNGPSGASVTSKRNSNFPHHSSLFFGADFVNGGNYWQEGLEEGQIISVKSEILESGGERVVIVDECLWVRPGVKSPFKDTRTITITSPGDGLYQIDFEITLHPLKDVTIDRNNHSLFSGRMDPDLAVINGGTMVNAEGDEGESGTFGKSSAWVSYFGNRGDGVEGMTIMQHPENDWADAPWFTRDYGFFSPTPIYWPEDEDAGTFVRQGDTVNLKYRVIVHSGNPQEAAIPRHYELFRSE
jgi:hypothetical protein